ncbi:MAG: cytochrome c biogenesis protein CcdA, partial [Patescibacteria group bacterium]
MGLTLAVTFVAGIISFLSPCILPIVPGFLTYLAGTNADSPTRRRDIFIASVFFVLGFSVVFSSVGVLLNTILEAVAYDAQVYLARIGGVIIILFGLYLTGLIKIPFLEREHKFAVRKKFNSKLVTSFVFGAAFAAGWTPCVGAVLGSILGLAATAPSAAFGLLFSYSLGLGLPFLAVGLFTNQAVVLIERYASYFKYAKILFGIFLVIIGIGAFTQTLSRFSNLELLRG